MIYLREKCGALRSEATVTKSPQNDPAEPENSNTGIFGEHWVERWAPFCRREDEIGNKIMIVNVAPVVVVFHGGFWRCFRISSMS